MYYYLVKNNSIFPSAAHPGGWIFCVRRLEFRIFLENKVTPKCLAILHPTA